LLEIVWVIVLLFIAVPRFQKGIEREKSRAFASKILSIARIAILGFWEWIGAKGKATAEAFDFSAGDIARAGGAAFASVSTAELNEIADHGASNMLDVGISSRFGSSNIIYVIGDVDKGKRNSDDYAAANHAANTTHDTVDVSTDAAIISEDDITFLYKTNLDVISHGAIDFSLNGTTDEAFHVLATISPHAEVLTKGEHLWTSIKRLFQP
jgi:hypothetical protein